MDDISFSILAGGQSARFKSDKRLALHDGRTLLEIMIEKGRSLGWPILLSVRSEQHLDALRSAVDLTGLRTLLDPEGVEGPAAGLLSTLSSAPTRYVFATSTDLPLLDSKTAARLFTLAAASSIEICVPRTRRGIEPLASVYSTDCLAEFRSFVDAGGRSPEKFILSLPSPRVQFVDFDELESRQFANINTPEDLEAVQTTQRCAVVPAKAGTQTLLDSRLRGNDTEAQCDNKRPDPLRSEEREPPLPERSTTRLVEERVGVRVSGSHAR